VIESIASFNYLLKSSSGVLAGGILGGAYVYGIRSCGFG